MCLPLSNNTLKDTHYLSGLQSFGSIGKHEALFWQECEFQSYMILKISYSFHRVMNKIRVKLATRKDVILVRLPVCEAALKTECSTNYNLDRITQ